MPKRRLNTIKNIVLVTIGCAFLVIMICNVGPNNIYRSILKADIWTLASALCILSIAITMKSIRWVNLFRRAKPADACKVFFIGQGVNEIAPVGSGELTRAYVAKSRLNIPVAETIAPAAIERTADTTFLVAMSVVCLTMSKMDITVFQIIIIPFFILLVSYILLIKPWIIGGLASKIERFSNNKGNFLKMVGSHVSGSLRLFKDAIIKFHKKKTILFQTIFLTTIIWLIEALGQYTILLAFDIHVPIFYVLAIMSTSLIVGAFSFMPGGLGSRDAVLVILLGTQGVPIEIGLSMALIYRGFAYLLTGGGAFVSLLSFSTKK